MNFIDYDTISDKLVWLSKDISLSMTVKLGKRDSNGFRKFFHNEYSYDASSSYKGVGTLGTIKRNYDSYLVIESVDRLTYIQIRLDNILSLRYNLEYMTKEWLLSDNIWAIKNGKLLIKGTIKPVDIVGLPMGKWLSFSPTPILDMNNSYTKGVRITLSDYDIFVDVSIDRFMGLTYIFQTINLFEQAAIMLNYMANSDIYGINTYDIRDSIPPEDNFKGPSRQIPKKSFFDK